jgi:hypothetical protein
MKPSIVKYAVFNAAGTAVYVALVATFLSHTAQIFDDVPQKTALIPMAMLLLLVLSASVTGGFVLGRPVLWYLDGKKKEAVTLFIATLGCVFLIMVAVFVFLATQG